MDIAGKARKLERKITRTIEAAVEEFVGPSAITPIEIVHAVLDRAEQQIQDVGRGRRTFPFNHVRVHVAAAPKDKEARGRLAAVLDGPPSLAERLIERLRTAGCGVIDLETEIVFARASAPEWVSRDFHVEFDRVAKASAPPPVVEPQPPISCVPIRLAVVKGTADQRGYVFKGGRIDIGRRAEVFDQHQRLIRTNHIAFQDEAGDNETVSRRHAHIDYDAVRGAYRVWDDRSVHGTNIIRNGRTIRVPAGARGTRLEAGDEIVLGAARLKVSFTPAPPVR